MSGTPPGWYPDAQGVNRWFDGTSWTEHTQAVPVTPPPPPAPLPPAPPAPAGWGNQGYQTYGQATGQPYGAPGPTGPRRRTGLIVGLSSAGVLLVVLAVVGAVLLVRGSDDTTTASSTTLTSEPAVSDPTASSEPVTPSSPASTSAPAGAAGSSDPEEVADGFMAAIFSGDCAAAEKYVSDQLVESEGSCGGTEIPTGAFDGVTYEVGSADVTGDTATVPVTLEVDLGDDVDLGDIPGTKLTLTMERQGSRWLVSNLA